MESSRQKLSALLHGSALPPPPKGRALIFGAVGAVAAAIAAGMASYVHELRIAYLGFANGLIVGMAIIRAKGYGRQLMSSAAMLTIFSIVMANFVAYYVVTISEDPDQANPGSFFDYLNATGGAVDLLLAAVSAAIAVGMIHLRTAKLEHRAKAKLLAERQQ